MSSFALSIKSTLDKILVDSAIAKGHDYFDLDGSYMDPIVAESESTAIVWSLLSLSEYPRDPFWQIQFEAGARTANDCSQYDSLEIISYLQSLFSVGMSYYIKDYSGHTTPTENLGEIIISSVNTAPAVFDRVSGIRAAHVTATVQRFP